MAFHDEHLTHSSNERKAIMLSWLKSNLRPTLPRWHFQQPLRMVLFSVVYGWLIIDDISLVSKLHPTSIIQSTFTRLFLSLPIQGKRALKSQKQYQE
jgi:hypothetical protein